MKRTKLLIHLNHELLFPLVGIQDDGQSLNGNPEQHLDQTGAK